MPRTYFYSAELILVTGGNERYFIDHDVGKKVLLTGALINQKITRAAWPVNVRSPFGPFPSLDEFQAGSRTILFGTMKLSHAGGKYTVTRNRSCSPISTRSLQFTVMIFIRSMTSPSSQMRREDEVRISRTPGAHGIRSLKNESQPFAAKAPPS
jgi:hypothetical protein